MNYFNRSDLSSLEWTTTGEAEGPFGLSVISGRPSFSSALASLEDFEGDNDPNICTVKLPTTTRNEPYKINTESLMVSKLLIRVCGCL